MSRIKLAVVLLTIAALTSCGSGKKNAAVFDSDSTVFAMDTMVSISGSANDIKKAEDVLFHLDALFDRYSYESDIYRINSRISGEVSPETVELIYNSIELSERYGNEVNIFSGNITDAWSIGRDEQQVPSAEEIAYALETTASAAFSVETMSFADHNGSIDAGSVAKGFSLDKIKEQLSDECCIVSMTSSILLHGEKSDGTPFSVEIRDPDELGASIGVIRTEECFISTSGGYERFFEQDGKRYSHIFDLKTGYPCETDLTSVTVMCGSGIESDFLSTLIFIGGTEQLGKYLANDEIKVIAVTDSKNVYVSDGVDIEIYDNSGYTLVK